VTVDGHMFSEINSCL